MNLIEFKDDVTKANAATFNQFQKNINDGKAEKSIVDNTIKSVKIAGNLAAQDMAWRILKLPNNWNGIMFITSPNYAGQMQNNMVAISNSYGVVGVDVILGTVFAGKLFKQIRVIQKNGENAYIELITNGTINEIELNITVIGSAETNTLEFLNTIGKIEAGYSAKLIDL